MRTACEPSREEGPPKMPRNESLEEKIWRKFSQQPLVPIGCMATAYFLASGIKSFRDRDPVKSQRMMKARVMAQFATLMCFIGYLGVEKLDFRIAPMYQDAKKAQAQQGQDRSAE
ncbi:hypothetical protein FisN_8Lh086 [Fistulifera solaris]|uniref:HIG1 domain-containing protein n=1 Tax=Fistulifera solaris TaxID=1519565 RepID=A0A1Z5JDN4_FISSO|nr:hypothetical protein FisN_8Lh086 [Fistulifera solaris]|eukprot:GAX11992.1 hypothetical protein FisN_8Lh086 [Fistulifera solaris]